MTSESARRALAALLVAAGVGGARAAEPPLPFEGTWVRANRVCEARAPQWRTYTGHDVSFPSGRCTFRKVARGEGQFEIFEDCRRPERSGRSTETIRMLGPDLMQVRRQEARLKIPRPLRYARCAAAGAPPAPSRTSPFHHPAEPPRPPADGEGAEPKP